MQRVFFICHFLSVVLLKSVPEKVLGQVFRVLVIDIPFQSNVFVDRLPITVENGAESSLTNMWLFTANRDDGGAIRLWKFSRGSPNVGIRIIDAISPAHYHSSTLTGFQYYKILAYGP